MKTFISVALCAIAVCAIVPRAEADSYAHTTCESCAERTDYCDDICGSAVEDGTYLYSNLACLSLCDMPAYEENCEIHHKCFFDLEEAEKITALDFTKVPTVAMTMNGTTLKVFTLDEAKSALRFLAGADMRFEYLEMFTELNGYICQSLLQYAIQNAESQSSVFSSKPVSAYHLAMGIEPAIFEKDFYCVLLAADGAKVEDGVNDNYGTWNGGVDIVPVTCLDVPNPVTPSPNDSTDSGATQETTTNGQTDTPSPNDSTDSGATQETTTNGQAEPTTSTDSAFAIAVPATALFLAVGMLCA